MTDIKLPELPVLNWTARTEDVGGPIKWVISSEQLRARDLEVARAVLEAAAEACFPDYWADEIRNLKVSHD